MEFHRNHFCISTDYEKLNLPTIHGFLKQSYWAENIPASIVERAVRNSLSFGLYKGEEQIGFARVITDYATFAYLADVFILDSYRGQGLSKWLLECVMQHPELQGLRRWLLATNDAHGLYAQFGFTSLKAPDIFMEIYRPDIYKSKT